MLAMTAFFMLVELIVGNLTNSMALVADSFHMLSDVIALVSKIKSPSCNLIPQVIAYISVEMSPKEWSKNTFGWARAEVRGCTQYKSEPWFVPLLFSEA